MNITLDLVEKAIINQGFKSDYQLAQALEIDRRKISNWRRSVNGADAEMTLKLMKLSGVTIDEVLNKYEKGNASVSLLGVTALLSTLALASYLTVKHCILCQIKWQLTKTRQTQITRRETVARLQIA